MGIMAGPSKNSPGNKGVKMVGKMVTSSECEGCCNKCAKGIAYLERFAIQHEGKGLFCKSVK